MVLPETRLTVNNGYGFEQAIPVVKTTIANREFGEGLAVDQYLLHHPGSID